MKKLCLLLVLFSSVAFAQSGSLPICQGAGVHLINIFDSSNTQSWVQKVIFEQATNQANRYDLCFVYDRNVSQKWTNITDAPLRIPSAADRRPIVISGLDLRRVDNANKNLPIVFTAGEAGVILHNSKLTCVAGTPRSIGIQLLGEAHQVIGTEIQSCGVGIQVGDATTAGNNMRMGPANKIHDNHRGVFIAKGSGNFIQQNSIYKNDANGDSIFAQDEGIKLLPGTNGDIQAPTLLKNTGDIAIADDPVLTYPQGTSQLPLDNQTPIMAALQIQLPFPPGDMELDLVGENLYQQGSLQIAQGGQFLADLNCTSDATSYSCQVPMTQGKKDQKALLLFHYPILGTAPYSLRVSLNGPSANTVVNNSPIANVPSPPTQDPGGLPPASGPLPEPASTTASVHNTKKDDSAGGPGGPGGTGGSGGGLFSCNLSRNATPGKFNTGLILLIIATMTAKRFRKSG